METKKDIYNLWIQYTTKNDETFFRQFILGFVQIWEHQLNIDFDKPPLSSSIKPDLGPHLNRLPDELLPAIGKFLIIAKDNVQQEGKIQSPEELIETTLLIKCLIVMCRHFDNINTIANYEYISSVIALSINLIQMNYKSNVKPTVIEIQFIKSACQLIEVIYDPYLIWRNFLHFSNKNQQQFSNNKNYPNCQLQVEIVPFIYDCFQCDKILSLPEIGINLINTLGSIIAGSQNYITSINKLSRGGGGSGGGGCSFNGNDVFNIGNPANKCLHNGMRAISPATVTILIELISKWECNSSLRIIALKCLAIMAIVLQRTSPEERQIELVTICQFYLAAIQTLLKTDHFLPKSMDEKWKIASADDDNESYIDVNAFLSFIDNIEIILSDEHSQIILCNALMEANVFSTMITLMQKVCTWNIDLQSLAACIVRSICFLTRMSPQMCLILRTSKNMKQLFNGLFRMGRPTQKLLKMCLNLAYNDSNFEIIFGDIFINLIDWLKDMHENEQIFLSDNLTKICLQNSYCKSVVSQERIIKSICESLQNHSLLNKKCVLDLIKLLEEIGKYSISSIELKNVFWLLRKEMDFAYHKQLLQAIAAISLNNISNSVVCNEYFDIRNISDGITVPDIRKWTISGPYGFVFHAWLRFDDLNKMNENNTDRVGKDSQNFRRIILSMLTNQGTGFEVFLQSSGQIVVGVLTKKEYLAASVPKSLLLDNRWHLITVGITKRSTSYTQILVYVDGIQKLEALFQFVGITEPFSYCTIGSFYHRIKKNSRPSYGSQTSTESSSGTSSFLSIQSPNLNSNPNSPKSSGGFPSFMDRSFIPQIVSQVPKYFTLPLRNTTSRDPNIKNYPIGMQDSVFGEPLCLKGQLGSILLAEPTTNIKTILDAGYNFASIISQDIEPYDLTSKYIFCYSPSSCYDGLCIDLVPGNKYNGHVMAKFCKTIKIQDSINSIGGIYTLLPILDIITKSKENTQYVFTDNSNGSSKETSLITVSPTTHSGGPGSPIIDDFTDYEIIQSTKYTEWKIMQNSVACFLCLIRYFIQNHEINQEHLLKSNGIEIIGAMLVQCNPMIIDVNVLMGTHLLVESIQNQLNNQNTELLEIVYTELIFNFNIWSKGQFQIIIGHIQYINTMIKDNRKYFRKKFGIQYFLDVIRQYFVIPNNLSPEDGRAIRGSLLDNVKYYIQKELSFKEVGVILSYISTIKYEHLIIELLELLNNCMKSKGCKDQIFLLLHEPQTAELLYFLFTERSFSYELHSTVITFLNCLLETNCVSRNHKSTLRLHDLTVGSLFPGLFSFMKPFTINNKIIMKLYDQIVTDESENKYCALLYLIHHINPTDIDLKLEISRKLLRITFEQKNAAHLLAQQIGWQESITRLLIKKSINEHIDKVKHSDSYSDFDMSNDEYSTDILNQTDLITFDEKTMELSAYEGAKDHHLLLTEFQASVTEAANVIEHEIKGMAESVAEKVGENISSVYSILRQRTCDIQEQFETAIGGPIDHKLMKSNPSLSTQSSNSTSNENVSIKSTDGKSTETCTQIESDDDKEKQLIYLVTHILFNILWHGLENESDNKDTWKKRGQVIASINLLVLKNELHCSHVTLRLKILELSIDAMCKSLIESGHNLHHQQNAAQLLRIVYDLVILDSTEDDLNNKCSMVLLDGVLALLDALFVFSSTGNDDWSEMTRLFLGLLIKCSQYPNEDIVAKATARLHAIVQSRTTQNSDELAYLIYSINKPLNASIEIAQPEQYSFLIPVMRTLLHRSRSILSLGVNLPDLPSTTSGPIFFNDFQMYICSKQWINFVDKKMKPLHDSYQADVNNTITEPLNIFWAECYESYKKSSQKRTKYLTECRLKFKHKIALPWRIRQTEEINRLNGILSSNKIKENQFERRWKSIKRFLHSPRGAWSYK